VLSSWQTVTNAVEKKSTSSSALKMKAAYLTKMFLISYQTYPEDSNIHIHCNERHRYIHWPICDRRQQLSLTYWSSNGPFPILQLLGEQTAVNGVQKLAILQLTQVSGQQNISTSIFKI
jgi:hypothetical protein